MDKGLKMLEDLKKQLDELRLQESKNDENLNLLKEQHADVNNSIDDLKNRIEELNDSKKDAKDAPKKYKEERNQIIKMLTVVTLILFVVSSLYVGVNTIVGNLGFNYFLKMLIFLMFADPILVTMIGTMLIISSKPKYITNNLESIEKEIQQQMQELESQKDKKNKIGDKITELETIKSSLQQEINQIENKINCITNVRSKVIEDFCKYNCTLDKLLDLAYDTQIENNQQKVKKFSNN